MSGPLGAPHWPAEREPHAAPRPPAAASQLEDLMMMMMMMMMIMMMMTTMMMMMVMMMMMRQIRTRHTHTTITRARPRDKE